MSAAIAVNEQTFQTEVLESSLPVLVDFWAPHCPPCRALSPTIDALSQEYAGRVKVVKVNCDDAGAVAIRYGVMNIPVLLLFKDGRPVDQMLGFQPKARIAAKLDALL